MQFFMGRTLLYIFLICTFCSCDYYLINPHKNQVGVIEEGSFWEEDEFELCYKEKIFPGYYGRTNSGFSKSRDTLNNYFNTHFDNNGFTNATGYITVRFIINCKGETGRYEIKEVGPDFKKTKFNKYLTEHILDLVKNLETWTAVRFQGYDYDSFYHITFKLENGELVEILS